MVILWTNLEGEKLEPSPTAPVAGSNGGPPPPEPLKRRVQVAVRPSLPSLFLPLIHQPDRHSDEPVSLASSPGQDDDPQQNARLIIIKAGDISTPDSGMLVNYDPPPVSPARPSSSTASSELPVVYGSLPLLCPLRQETMRGE